MESKRDSAEANAKLILKEAVDAARVLVAGGNEVGAGLKRADAVREAGLQMLDRLFPDFGPGDSATWEKALGDAKKRIPDALKAVGHAGDAQDHAVCKAVLKAMSPAKKGADLRNHFGGPPYGWPRDAVDAALGGRAQDGLRLRRLQELLLLLLLLLLLCHFAAGGGRQGVCRGGASADAPGARGGVGAARRRRRTKRREEEREKEKTSE